MEAQPRSLRLWNSDIKSDTLPQMFRHPLKLTRVRWKKKKKKELRQHWFSLLCCQQDAFLSRAHSPVINGPSKNEHLWPLLSFLFVTSEAVGRAGGQSQPLKVKNKTNTWSRLSCSFSQQGWEKTTLQQCGTVRRVVTAWPLPWIKRRIIEKLLLLDKLCQCHVLCCLLWKIPPTFRKSSFSSSNLDNTITE